jgi:alpha-tubulin suppressor-like RCC1 family protein
MRISFVYCLAGVTLAACDLSTQPGRQLPDDPALPPASHAVGLAMAGGTTCALTADGRLHCWGENRFGEFGNGTTTGSTVPVDGGGGLTFERVTGSMGTPQMCGTTADGASYCWGYNANGELGDGTTEDRSQPVAINSDIQFRTLASSYHSCGLSVDNIAYCWGDGLGGQLGTGSEIPALQPARVAGTGTYSHITNGMQFSCALAQNGLAECWGWGAGLGSGSADRSVLVPTAVSGGHVYQDISAGEEHVCALTQAGELYCWGKMSTSLFLEEPARIPTSVRFASVKSGSRMFVRGASCGLTADGVAYCWHSGLEPVRVPGGYRFAGLVGGHRQFCGFTPGGSVLCWQWLSVGPPVEWAMSPPQRAPSLDSAP